MEGERDYMIIINKNNMDRDTPRWTECDSIQLDPSATICKVYRYI